MNQLNVGSITLINLTRDKLTVWVNSKLVSFCLDPIESRQIILAGQAPSPVPLEAQVAYGYHPVYRIFLRSLDPKPGYFHQGINTVRVEQANRKYNQAYEFKLGDGDEQRLDASATISISYDDFIVTCSDGKKWFLKGNMGNETDTEI